MGRRFQDPALDPAFPTDTPSEGPTDEARYIDFTQTTPGPDSPLIGPLDALDGDPPLEFQDKLPRLGVRYRAFDVESFVQKVVLDFSGLGAGDDLDVEAFIHVTDEGWDRWSLPDGETTFCRSDEEFDRILFVLADHSHSKVVEGSHTLEPLFEACIKGTFNIDLTPASLNGGGHYEGEGSIDCTHGADGTWLVVGFFVGGGGPVYGFTISPDGMNVDIRGASPEQGDPWIVLPGMCLDHRVDLHVDDSLKPARVTALGTTKDVTLSVKATCPTVLRG